MKKLVQHKLVHIINLLELLVGSMAEIHAVLHCSTIRQVIAAYTEDDL